MTRRRLLGGLLVALLGLLALALGLLLRPTTSLQIPPLPPRALVVSYLKVGHGEASWVKTPDGRFLVIGAGPPESGEHVVASLRAAGAQKIDLLVLPYPYSESLGGARALIARFPIKAALELGWEQVNQHQQETRLALQQQGILVQSGRAGQAFDLGHGGRLDVLFPHEPRVAKSPAAANNALVLRLTWGQTHFLWEGGLEGPGEQALLSLGQTLTADVLRVARFGNPGASSPELLAQVEPRFVVVSAEDPARSLPARSTLERLKATGAALLRLDQQPRDLFFFSDGKQVTHAN
jgi:competence protein ComEC